MNRHPLTPSPDFTYERHSGEEADLVVALNDEGSFMGAEKVRHFNLPLVSESLKAAIQEVRMRQAEVKAGQQAGATRKSWDNKMILMEIQ